MADMQAYFESRLTPNPRREVLWQILCRHYFSGMVPKGGCVLELRAGYGHFINNIEAKRKIAMDLWDGFRRRLQPGIEAHVGVVEDLSFLEDRSVDFCLCQ